MDFSFDLGGEQLHLYTARREQNISSIIWKTIPILSCAAEKEWDSIIKEDNAVRKTPELTVTFNNFLPESPNILCLK